MEKKDFIDWLKNTTELSSYSIGRYANAIDTLSDERLKYNIQVKDLFQINDPALIDAILDNPKFQNKNNKGNRMYSAALNHFKNFIIYFNERKFETELFKEELEFNKYLEENDSGISRRIIIEDKVQGKPNYKTVNNQKIWSRNPKYASEVVASANYLCEFNQEHQYFVSKYNQKNYVEAHHLIPMKYHEFDCSLDIYGNIVSLCVVCHKQIHFGLFEEKKVLLDHLFNSRKERLRASGIDIELGLLYQYYQE